MANKTTAVIIFFNIVFQSKNKSFAGNFLGVLVSIIDSNNTRFFSNGHAIKKNDALVSRIRSFDVQNYFAAALLSENRSRNLGILCTNVRNGAQRVGSLGRNVHPCRSQGFLGFAR